MTRTDSAIQTETAYTPASAKFYFRPDIEGLRAVAVLAAVLFHAAVPGVRGGYVGVDVFFVISGFLITGMLWREANTSGTVQLRSFYGARARRLLPASATVGVITMAASLVLMPPVQVPTVLHDGIASALYVSNYWSLSQQIDYFAAAMARSPFLHYWSLSVEEQFYLLWPALILITAWLIRLVSRRNRTEATASQRPYLAVLVLVAVVSFALSLAVSYIVPPLAFFSLPTRSWQLALGGLVALTATRWRTVPPRAAATAGWMGLGLILLACFWLTEATLYPGVAATLPTVGTALVIGAGCAAPDRGCNRMLSVSPMRAIGRVSYSWYLWHWPVLVLAPFVLGHPLGLPARVSTLLVSAILAAFTLRFIENPLRFTPAISRSAWRSLALGAVATAIAVCTGLALLRVVPTSVGPGVPSAPMTISAAATPTGSSIGAYDDAIQKVFRQVQTEVAASAGLKDVPSNLTPPLAEAWGQQALMFRDHCLRSLFDSGQPECVSGDVGSVTSVAVVGDSQAAMWSPAFHHIAEQRRWRLETLGRGGCPPLNLHIEDAVRRFGSMALCEQWRDEVLTRLKNERPRLVVVGMWRGYGVGHSYVPGFTSYDPAWLDALTRLVKQLREAGSEVLVLGPVPTLEWNASICLSGHLDNASACAPSRSDAVNEAGIAAEAAATRAAGGIYADLTNLFCTSDRCPAIVGNSLVFFDDRHLTDQYSRALAPAIEALADRALANGRV